MPELPLQGVRIIDLSMWFAGPMCTRLLGDMGAEVIKVESLQHIDPWRGEVDQEKAKQMYPTRIPNTKPYDCSPGFNLQNRNKYGITLDLKTSEGIEIIKNLVKISDVLVENYSPRVMPKLGLDYSVLRKINPQIIMMSLPALGSTGPDKDYLAFGQTIDCMSGMAYRTGYIGEEPMLQSGLSYGDPLSGMNAAFAVVSALINRRRTNEGIHIDLSQVEGLISFNADSILDFTMNGHIRERIGNRDLSMAPHGCYRCKGEDQWVTIAIPDDITWEKFITALGSPAWSREERFCTVINRFDNQDELDRLIENWTLTHEPYEIMYLLQQVDIPAGPVLDAKQLIDEPHLNARGFFEITKHPVARSHPEISAFALFSKTPIHIRMPAPCLGEHNEFVFGQILGMSADRMKELENRGVIGKVPYRRQQGGM
jgi:crotonobetainyl-CoA:carnitine CoA-transferase CaiB-like acyl-CoA transferase